MIDFHSHILPGIDDGSKNADESLRMLNLLKGQGVSKVVATPHFYANHNSVEDFLRKRENAFSKLSHILNEDVPEIILGAEVKYYEGISRLDNLSKLCIGKSKLLLLEMSMKRWTEYTLREVREISNSGNVIIVLAHIERYLGFQPKGTIEELVENGIFIQSNADFFIDMRTRRKALKLLNNGLIHFIGSDCHNLDSRAPRIDEAISYIKRKSGEDLLSQIKSLGERFL